MAPSAKLKKCAGIFNAYGKSPNEAIPVPSEMDPLSHYSYALSMKILSTILELSLVGRFKISSTIYSEKYHLFSNF
jgi:hypothetical protein